jgi:hypothetical protein
MYEGIMWIVCWLIDRRYARFAFAALPRTKLMVEMVDWLAFHSRKFQTTQQIENDNALSELLVAVSRYRLHQ